MKLNKMKYLGITALLCTAAGIIWAEGDNQATVLSTGLCGDSATYTIYSDGSMIIDGSGAIYDYYLAPPQPDLNPDEDADPDSEVLAPRRGAADEEGSEESDSTTVVHRTDRRDPLWTSVTSLEIKSGITQIGTYAFSGCSLLTDIIVPESPAILSDVAFDTIAYSSCKLTTPSLTSYRSYKADEVWKKFTNITVNDSIPMDSIGFEQDTITVNHGDAVKLSPTLYPAHADGLDDLVWTSSNDSIVNADDFIARRPGTTVITCTSEQWEVSASYVVVVPAQTLLLTDAENGIVYLFETGEPSCGADSVIKDFSGVARIAETWSDGLSLEAPVSYFNTDMFIGTHIQGAVIPDYLEWNVNEFLNCTDLEFIATYHSSESGVVYDSIKAVVENSVLVYGFKNAAIPDTVTTIGEKSYYSRSGMDEITIPANVTAIGDSAFSYCDKLATIYVGETPAALATTAFDETVYASCTIVTSTLESYRLYKEAEGWKNFANITVDFLVPIDSITFAQDTLTVALGASAYQAPVMNPAEASDVKLTWTYDEEYISLGDSLYTKRPGTSVVTCTCAQWNVSASYVVVVPAEDLYIADEENGITYIVNTETLACGVVDADKTFSGIVTIENAINAYGNIYASVGYITDSIFQGAALQGMVIPSPLNSTILPEGDLSAIADMFYGCPNIEFIVSDGDTINTVISNDTLVFGFKDATIPENVKVIGNYAYAGRSGMTEITIPDSVTAIGDSAFYNCSQLSEIHVGKTPVAITASTFEGVDVSACTLYVPYGCAEAYQNDPYWGQFANIVEMEPTYLLGDPNNDGKINALDLVALVNFIFDNGGADNIFEAADMDGNGTINAVDYVALVNLIMSQPETAPTRGEELLSGYLSMEPWSLNAGEQTSAVINLDGASADYTCIQFDLQLPWGIRIVNAESLSSSHALTYATMDNGSTRFLLASSANKPISSTDGIIRLTFKADESMAAGEYSLSTDNTLFATSHCDAYTPADMSIQFSVSNTSGIDTLGNDATSVKAYNLSGQAIDSNAAQHVNGVYVIDGKKVSVSNK